LLNFGILNINEKVATNAAGDSHCYASFTTLTSFLLIAALDLPTYIARLKNEHYQVHLSMEHPNTMVFGNEGPNRADIQVFQSLTEGLFKDQLSFSQPGKMIVSCSTSTQVSEFLGSWISFLTSYSVLKSTNNLVNNLTKIEKSDKSGGKPKLLDWVPKVSITIYT
jgi:hypothetical protein